MTVNRFRHYVKWSTEPIYRNSAEHSLFTVSPEVAEWLLENFKEDIFTNASDTWRTPDMMWLPENIELLMKLTWNNTP